MIRELTHFKKKILPEIVPLWLKNWNKGVHKGRGGGGGRLILNGLIGGQTW